MRIGKVYRVTIQVVTNLPLPSKGLSYYEELTVVLVSP